MWSATSCILLLFVFGTTTVLGAPPPDLTYERTYCDPRGKECSFSLYIEERLTMMAYSPNDSTGRYKLAVPVKGRLYRVTETNQTEPYALRDEEVIQADGYYPNPRPLILANNSLPGPNLTFYAGQKIQAKVVNLLKSEAITIHWHGLHQKGSSFMDGVSFVSQCPILPGQEFTYEFTALTTGTHWYHAHSGAQRTQGLFGALLVLERPKRFPTTEDQIPNVPLIVNDWNHNWDSNTGHLKMAFNAIYDENLQNVGASESLDGSLYSVFQFTSGLINGKGRYRNSTTNQPSESPLSVFRVKQSRRLHFRVINAGTMHPFRFWIAKHELIMTASDGNEFAEQIVESFIINPGERYDFKLYASEAKGNYLIRADTLQIGRENYAEAILHYEADGVPDPEIDPDYSTLQVIEEKRACYADNPCLVLNCPFDKFDPEVFPATQCLHLSELEAESDEPVADEVVERFYNFGFPGENGYNAGSINGIRWVHPSVPAYGNEYDLEYLESSCTKQTCSADEVCACTHTGALRNGVTYRFILSNVGNASSWAHPVHLHGYSFQVLKQGFSFVNYTNRQATPTTDLTCADSKGFCNAVRWAVPSGSIEWDQNPITKDTVMVPSGGYTVIQFTANNPGIWFMHCHIELHNLDGMAMMFIERSGNEPIPQLPVDFPVCYERDPVVGTIEDSAAHRLTTHITLLIFSLLASGDMFDNVGE